jgi:hypothetical protein
MFKDLENSKVDWPSADNLNLGDLFMKTIFISMALVLSASSVTLAANSVEKVTCFSEARYPYLTFFISTSDDGTNSGKLTEAAYSIAMDQNSAPEVHNLKVNEAHEARIGYRRLNFVWIHHNTVIKVSADADIFGGTIRGIEEDAYDSYKGVLYMEFGNDENNKIRDTYRITCRLRPEHEEQ